MVRIGHFARLCQVSIKTLRYYDEVGLLTPEYVDPDTGYRWYAIEQIAQVHRIMALKNLGLSLEQITTLQANGMSMSEFKAMLRLKHIELRQQLLEAQMRLDQVEAQLTLLDHQEHPASYDVVMKSVDSFLAATIRAPLEQFADIGALTAEIYAYLQPLHLDGIDGAILYDYGEAGPGVDAEGFVMLERTVPSTSRITVRYLPAVERMASLVHHGTYATLSRSYTALMTWIEANDYTIIGPGREVYLHGGVSQYDPSFVTELQFPIARHTSSST